MLAACAFLASVFEVSVLEVTVLEVTVLEVIATEVIVYSRDEWVSGSQLENHHLTAASYTYYPPRCRLHKKTYCAECAGRRRTLRG